MQKIDIRTQLKDSSLFKEEAFVDGNWVSSKKTFTVNNPATDEIIANVANLETVDPTVLLPPQRGHYQNGATNLQKSVPPLCVSGSISLLRTPKI